MGCTVRHKHVRANRKHRSAKSESDHSNPADRAAEPSNSVIVSKGVSQKEYGLEVGDGKSVGAVGQKNPSLGGGNGWGYCTEEQLEGLLLRNLDFLYREAISTLMIFGQEEEVAFRALLKNGHCYGSMDALSNIVMNALTFLNDDCGCSDDDEEGEGCEMKFENLRQLAEYTLDGLVCLLRQIRPQMSRGDALWCLLMGDLRVGRDALVPSKFCDGCGNDESDEVNENGVVGSEVGIPPRLCKFHGGWGFGDGKAPEVHGKNPYMQPEKVECSKRLDHSHPMKATLYVDDSASAAGFQSNSRKVQIQPHACPSVLSLGVPQSAEQKKVPESGLTLDVVLEMLRKFQEMKLDEKTENIGDSQSEEMKSALMQIADLEKQVEERKKWAREKAMQAARKLSSDLTELKILRMEREEATQLLKNGKQNLDEPIKKRFADIDSALKKACGKVDRVNADIKRLQNENAEMRAEMEAAKLSASENMKTCLEIAKREKKSVKRLLAWEKQKTKLQEEINAEKKKITEFRREIIQVEQAQKVTEAKWKQEIEDKDQAIAQVEELKRTKEAKEAEYKRRHEALRLKIEIDFRRHKDDLQRLEQELSHLKLSTNPVSSLSTKSSDNEKPQKDSIAKMLNELDLANDSSETEEYMNRECIICKNEDVSVVFLPCAHQVICAKCNESYGKKGKPVCPCCRVPIQQRICVFGASS